MDYTGWTIVALIGTLILLRVGRSLWEAGFKAGKKTKWIERSTDVQKTISNFPPKLKF